MKFYWLIFGVYLKIYKLIYDLKTWFGVFENWFVFWELILWFENWFVFSKLICDLKTCFVFWKLIWAKVYVIWKRVGPFGIHTFPIEMLEGDCFWGRESKPISSFDNLLVINGMRKVHFTLLFYDCLSLYYQRYLL